MKDYFSSLDADEKQALRPSVFPKWMAPQLATLTDERFSDAGWIYERKLDGERCIAFIQDGQAKLYSRNQKPLNIQYPEIVGRLSAAAHSDMVLDGEIVAFEDGVSSFSRLQERMHLSSREAVRKSQVAVFYYIFDILFLEGHDLTRLSQRSRKAILKKALEFSDPIRFLPHRDAEGEEYYQEACLKGWEGIIAKDASAPYSHKRSRHWLKFKCVHRQELVIGGYSDPEGGRIGFGALLLGFYKDGDLHYAGKVGTGFDDRELTNLKKRLDALEIDQAPFSPGKSLPHEGIHWVKPQLVAQIGFEEWTRNNRLRHPRYLGLRDDKAARDVRKEVAE